MFYDIFPTIICTIWFILMVLFQKLLKDKWKPHFDAMLIGDAIVWGAMAICHALQNLQ